MIEEVYQNALLAAAAYANWQGSTPSSIKNQLINSRGFTETQYNKFMEKYEVVDFTEDWTGFSATIFRNKDINDPNYNQYTLACRGTEPTHTLGMDFVQDLILALGRGTLHQFQDSKLGSFLTSSGIVLSDGSLNPNFQGINIVGHSLGGYLALVAADRLSGITDSTYTYNGAGFAVLDRFIHDYLHADRYTGKDVQHYYADKGVEFTSNDWE